MPAAHALRTAWSRAGFPPVERFVGDLDVFHFSDWMYPPQRGGIRSTMIHDLVPLHFPDWVHRRTRRMHGAKYRHAAHACDVVMVNSRFTGDDVAETLGVDRRSHPRRVSGRRQRLHAGGAEDRRRVRARGRDARAAQEPRERHCRGAAARRRAARRRRARLGRRRGAGLRHHLARLRRATRSFLRCTAAPLPLSTRRSSRGSACPSSRRWRAGRRASSPRTPRSTRPRGDAAVRADPDDADAIAAAIDRARSERDALVTRGLAHAAGFTWLANGKAHLAAWSR